MKNLGVLPSSANESVPFMASEIPLVPADTLPVGESVERMVIAKMRELNAHISQAMQDNAHGFPTIQSEKQATACINQLIRFGSISKTISYNKSSKKYSSADSSATGVTTTSKLTKKTSKSMVGYDATASLNIS